MLLDEIIKSIGFDPREKMQYVGLISDRYRRIIMTIWNELFNGKEEKNFFKWSL